MSKKPLQLALSIYAGQTFNDSLTWQDSAGVAIDLTGYTARMMAREDIADLVPKITWSDSTGELVLGGADGTVTFNVPAEVTAGLLDAIETTTWVYDMVLTSADGLADRLVQGSLTIYPGVTRG